MENAPSAISTQAEDSAGGADAEDVRQRLRIVYSKGVEVKFISHQDEFRLWERTLRRADLPLLYKQGFNPQPHLQFAAPLGVGFTGAREYVDIVLAPPLPLVDVRAGIESHLPPGVGVVEIEEIPVKADALAISLIGADYSIVIHASSGELAPEEVERRLRDFHARESIWRERERKGERYTYNLRPLVFVLRYEGYDALVEEHRLFLRVQQRTGATGRPDEVVAALGLEDFARTLCRERLYFAVNEADAGVFAAYPVIAQETIAGGKVKAARARLDEDAGRPRAGRTLGERAGDEFV